MISLGDGGVHGDDKVTDVMSERRAKRGHKNGPFTRLQTIIRQDTRLPQCVSSTVGLWVIVCFK